MRVRRDRSHDKKGEPLGLAISMSRGLLKKKMHVKFRAKFSKRGMVEGIEILRDIANDALRKARKDSKYNNKNHKN